jgi:hypothetical protein
VATNTWVDLEIREAETLADLHGAQFDLQTARDFALLLKEQFESKHGDPRLDDPLTTAILVRYSRPFVGGVRKRLDEQTLQILSATQRAAHDRLRAFRDKHIAHSVNAFEDNVPVARYWVERVDVEGITSISCNSHRVVGLSSADVESVIELTTLLLDHLNATVRDEEQRLLKIVRDKPLAEILTGKQRSFTPNDAKIHQRRKK